MSAIVDIGRTLDVWFSEGPLIMPDLLAESVAVRIATTPQRHERLPWLRSPSLHRGRLAQFTGALAALLVLAGLGYALVFSGILGPARPSPTPAASLVAPSMSPGPSGSPHEATHSPSDVPTAPPTSRVQSAPLGQLAPGTHRSIFWAPALTYTVPEGWQNTQDTVDHYILEAAGTTIHVLAHVRAGLTGADGCYRFPPNASASASDFAAAWDAVPDVQVQATPISLGGLSGYSVEYEYVEDNGPDCDGDPRGANYTFYVGGGAPFTSGVATQQAIVLDDTHGHTVLIEVELTGDLAPAEAQADPRMDVALGIINSFVFDPSCVPAWTCPLLDPGSTPSPPPPPLRAAVPDDVTPSLGPLVPGIYRSLVWAPALTYGVPDGWSIWADDRLLFGLERVGQGPGITVTFDARAGRMDNGCYAVIANGVTSANGSTSASDFVDALKTLPDMELIATPIVVGGLSGYSIAYQAIGAGPHCGSSPSSLAYTVWSTSGYPRKAVFGEGEHVFVLDSTRGATILVTIDAGSPALVGEALQVVDSFVFDPNCVNPWTCPLRDATSTPQPSTDTSQTGLSDLEPGTYTSHVWQPTLTYTVPDGWSNDSDGRTAFALASRSDPSVVIELVSDAYPPHRCHVDPVADWTRPHTARDLVDYLTDPEFFDTTATPVRIGGLSGWHVEGRALLTDVDDCAIFVINWPDGIPSILATSGDIGYLTALDDQIGHTVVLAVYDAQSEWTAEIDAIVESFQFLTP